MSGFGKSGHILSFEWQLNNMEHFLADNNEFGILTVLIPHTTLVISMLHLLHTHISCFKIQNPKISPYVRPYSGTPKHIFKPVALTINVGEYGLSN